MSGVFRTIDPPPPLHPASVSSPPAPKAGGTHSPGGEGVGVTISEDARHWMGLLQYNPSTVCAMTDDGLLGAGGRGGSHSELFCCQWSDTLATSFAYMFHPLITILMKTYKIWQTCSRENRAYFYIMLILIIYRQT